MAYLLELTGWYTTIDNTDYDHEYEEIDHEEYETQVISSQPNTKFAIPQRRYLGYTLFSETDDVYARALGITIPDGELSDDTKNEILAALKVKAESVYGTAEEGNYKAATNAINRYVAYHLCPDVLLITIWCATIMSMVIAGVVMQLIRSCRISQ